MDNKCKNCFLLNVIHNKKFKNKKLIKDISDNYDIDDLNIKSPSNKTLPIEIHHKIKQKNTWVLYWASNPTEDIILKNDKEAYQNNTNNGVTKTDSKGNLILKLNCPSIYTLDDSTHPRHVHFVLLKDNKWDTSNIHTAYILCDIDYDLMNKYVTEKQHLIINAIDIKGSKYTDNIPNSFYLKMPKTGTKKVKKEVVNKFISKNIKNYSKLSKLLKDKKIKIENLPMIVYCAHKKCDASKKLLKTLMDLGYNNVIDFSGGIEGWFNNVEDSESSSVEDKVIEMDGNKTIMYDGISYTITPDNKVLDDDFKIIGRYVNKKVIFNKSEYKKKHNKLKNISLYDDDEEDDYDDSDKDDENDENDEDDEDNKDDEDNEDDSDDDDDEDDDDDDDDEDDEDDDDDDENDEDDDDDDENDVDDEDDEDDEDDLLLSKSEINKIHKMSKTELRKELKKLKKQLKTGGDPELMQTCGFF
uniref:Rhodanese domain-containing protein n=1 Tax=viral metagenome TaxID=1070528 RepID=A0A6C0D0B1_9ZZZZ